MRFVLLIRCLPKMPPSSSTSTGSQTASLPPRGDPWHEQRRDFGCDLLSPSTGKMFVWHRRFLSEPGSARYSSTPSLTAVWSIRLYTTTSLKSVDTDFKEVCINRLLYQDFITKCSNCPLTSLTLELQITWPVILRSHWLIASQLTYTVTMTISM